MSKSQVENLFIVGAGFSYYAGLPLTDTFTKRLLNVADLKLEGPSATQVDLLKHFVQKTFEHGPHAAAKYWPQLEDIFTCIDLSANTGHHLGSDYSPSKLRTVRRALIVRIIRMLRQEYNRAKDAADENWNALEEFFELLPSKSSAFLSMNWDTVIEEGLKEAQSVTDYDYGCNALRAEFIPNNKIALRDSNPRIRVLKPHGSSNWLYCDSCRELFWFPPDKTERIAGQLFRASDWKVAEEILNADCPTPPRPISCPVCDAEALGTRFATFSYRKALDFPMHEASWRTAEQLLREAENWIFIGYSLPAADYEFKLLLKRVQLSRRKRPAMVLITGGSDAAVEQTQLAYQKFFGPKLSGAASNIFRHGLDKRALKALQNLGALKLATP